jgi:DedD protein
VASLGSPEAARDLTDRLRAQGFPAFVEQARVQGKLYYRVRVGPEIDRARADDIKRRLDAEVTSEPFVKRYP